MHLLPQEDSLAGYTRAVVKAEERHRRYMDQIDIEMEEKLAAQKKEHEMKMLFGLYMVIDILNHAVVL